LWPELRISRLSDVGLTIALDQAAAAHPPFGGRWGKARRTADPDLFVYDLVRAGEAPVLQALTEDPGHRGSGP
jgi:hypothetical protein